MKYDKLDLDYPLKETPSPSKERIENAKRILECEKYNEWRKTLE